MPDVDFFFDYSCPWTYLAYTRLKETATRTGARIVWRPILLDDLFEQVNPALKADRRDPDPRRAQYQAKDLRDWAHYCAVTIELPAGRPVYAEPAARGALAAERAGRMPAYSDAIFSAYFERGLDIGAADVVVEIAAAAGLNPEVIDAAVRDADSAAGVRANVDELIGRGGFGSPTLFVGDHMFFGNDRMPLVEFALGQASGRAFVMPGQHGP